MKNRQKIGFYYEDSRKYPPIFGSHSLIIFKLEIERKSLQLVPIILFTIGFFVPRFSNKSPKARLPFYTENVRHFLHYWIFLVQNNETCKFGDSKRAIVVIDFVPYFFHT